MRPGALGEGTTGGYVEVGNAHVAILNVPWIIGTVGWPHESTWMYNLSKYPVGVQSL